MRVENDIANFLHDSYEDFHVLFSAKYRDNFIQYYILNSVGRDLNCNGKTV